MTQSFDIFQIEGDGSVLWRAAAATLEDAEAQVQRLAATSPGEYLIRNQHTGSKLTVKCDGNTASGRSMSAE